MKWRTMSEPLCLETKTDMIRRMYWSFDIRWIWSGILVTNSNVGLTRPTIFRHFVWLKKNIVYWNDSLKLFVPVLLRVSLERLCVHNRCDIKYLTNAAAAFQFRRIMIHQVTSAYTVLRNVPIKCGYSVRLRAVSKNTRTMGTRNEHTVLVPWWLFLRPELSKLRVRSSCLAISWRLDNINAVKVIYAANTCDCVIVCYGINIPNCPFLLLFYESHNIKWIMETQRRISHWMTNCCEARWCSASAIGMAAHVAFTWQQQHCSPIE